ncbi:MAG: DUF4124 domain-containing protein [Deltaproteobacteria bacterium]|nr:DUF4124 domain-containing protein [Deltaproteobacteria bacterium]
MKLSLFILALITAVCAFSATPAAASVYRYIDKDGLEHITNDFNQIPDEYREQFYDKSEPEKPRSVINAQAELDASTASARERRAQAEAEATAQENDAPRTILQRLVSLAERYHALLALRIAAAIAAIIVIFIVGGRLSSAFGHKRLTTLIMLTLSAFVIMYLVSTNLQHVSDSFKDITGKVEKLEKKLNARQEMIRQRMEESGEHSDPGEEPQQHKLLENYPDASR